MTDSLITVVGTKTNEKATSISLLPEDVEVKHQTRYGIKTHIIRQKGYFTAEDQRSLVFCIAGAVPLGLHSLLYLEARLGATVFKGNANELADFVRGNLEIFWKEAYDQEIEYLFAFADEQLLHIYRIVGNMAGFKMLAVERTHGLLFDVIGDGADDVKREILSDTQALCVLGVQAETALFIACIRAVRRKIEGASHGITTIGGAIQMCCIQGKTADYLRVVMGEGRQYFRGVDIPEEAIEAILGYTGQNAIRLDRYWYDPSVSIATIANQSDAPYSGQFEEGNNA